MKRKRRLKETISCNRCREIPPRQAVKFVQRTDRIWWEMYNGHYARPDEVKFDEPGLITPVCRRCFEWSRKSRKRFDPDDSYETISTYEDYIIQETLKS